MESKSKFKKFLKIKMMLLYNYLELYLCMLTSSFSFTFVASPWGVHSDVGSWGRGDLDFSHSSSGKNILSQDPRINQGGFKESGGQNFKEIHGAMFLFLVSSGLPQNLWVTFKNAAMGDGRES